MSKYDVQNLRVRLGDHNIKTNSEANHVEKRVKRVIRHKGFSSSTLVRNRYLLKAVYHMAFYFPVEWCGYSHPGGWCPIHLQHPAYLSGTRTQEVCWEHCHRGRVGNTEGGRVTASLPHEGGREGVGELSMQGKLRQLCPRGHHQSHAVRQRVRQGFLQRE